MDPTAISLVIVAIGLVIAIILEPRRSDRLPGSRRPRPPSSSRLPGSGHVVKPGRGRP